MGFSTFEAASLKECSRIFYQRCDASRILTPTSSLRSRFGHGDVSKLALILDSVAAESPYRQRAKRAS